MIVIPGATVDHLSAVIDHRADHAVSICGEEGTPVDRDPADVDPCSRCLDAIEDPEAKLPEELRPDEEDELDEPEDGD